MKIRAEQEELDLHKVYNDRMRNSKKRFHKIYLIPILYFQYHQNFFR